MPKTEEAVSLMMNFAERTGLTSNRAPQRYLWTDAFAICNFLGLARLTGNEHYTKLALRLVDQVHHTLGQHRAGDSRSGWISGLSEQEGELHPTQAGLRIGKKLPERTPGEPFDDQLEWDRDGQYFHYLTKWMHALDQMTRATGDLRFNQWARELAEVAFRAFTYSPSSGGARRMHWKMSIDLTRALVPSMGQHDPLDGYITCVQLQSTKTNMNESADRANLSNEIKQLEAMIKGGDWTTSDPLGMGGLLTDAFRVYQLMRQGAVLADRLPENLLSASLTGLYHYARHSDLSLPAEYRLAFRELGLVIGLNAAKCLRQTLNSEIRRLPTSPVVHDQLHELIQYARMSEEIELFWRDPEHHRAGTWLEHRDINEVMLATSLASDGFLVLLTPH